MQRFGFPVVATTDGSFDDGFLKFTLSINWLIWSLFVYVMLFHHRTSRLTLTSGGAQISRFSSMHLSGLFGWMVLALIMLGAPLLIQGVIKGDQTWAFMSWLVIYYFVIPFVFAFLVFTKHGLKNAVLSLVLFSAAELLWPTIITRVGLVVNYEESEAQRAEDLLNSGYPIRIIDSATGAVMNNKSIYVTSPIIIHANVLVDELEVVNVLHAELRSGDVTLGTADLYPTSDPISNNRKNFLGTLTYSGVSSGESGSLEVSGIQRGNIGKVWIVFQ